MHPFLWICNPSTCDQSCHLQHLPSNSFWLFSPLPSPSTSRRPATPAARFTFGSHASRNSVTHQWSPSTVPRCRVARVQHLARKQNPPSQLKSVSSVPKNDPLYLVDLRRGALEPCVAAIGFGVVAREHDVAAESSCFRRTTTAGRQDCTHFSPGRRRVSQTLACSENFGKPPPFCVLQLPYVHGITLCGALLRFPVTSRIRSQDIHRCGRIDRHRRQHAPCWPN